MDLSVRTLFAGAFFLFFIISIFRSLEAQGQASSREAELERLMEIHYLRPEMKSSQDQVEISGSEARIRIWRDLPPNPEPEQIECLGYQWLLSGRGAKIGFGASEVFRRFPELQGISLELVEMDYKMESVDKKGKLKRLETPRLYLKMRVDRQELDRFRVDNEKVKNQLRSDTGSCLRLGRKVRIQKEINL